MDLTHKKVLSKLNYKKALVFIVSRNLKTKHIKGKTKKFSGYQTIGHIKVDDFQNLYVNFQLEEGSAVLIAIHKKDIQLIAQNHMNGHITLPFSKGLVRLRLIGEQATVNFEITKL